MNDSPGTAKATTGTTGESGQQIATVPTEISIAEQAIAIEERKFALAQRQAKVYAESALVPNEYRNNIGNVLIAQNMAKRMGADTLMVMQNLYIVHGKPGWSAAFLVASFNSNGRFSAIKYRFEGTPQTDDWSCTAFCTEHSSGETIEGTKITWKMANLEGWVNKNGSKWKTMPEQMFRYRAATFLIRSTAPEIGMGLLTKDELEDMGPNGNHGGLADGTRSRIDSLKEKLTEAPAPEPYFDATAEVLDDEEPSAATSENAVASETQELSNSESFEASSAPVATETAPTSEPADEKPLSKAESQKADQIAWITEFEGESVENAERVAKALDGRDLNDMSPGQVKDVYNGLQK